MKNVPFKLFLLTADNAWSGDAQGYLIVHNIGAGARLEDVLFAWRITGHYRYFTGDISNQ